MNKYRIALLTLILAALALRLTNLTYHSLWFDEAVSVYWARQSVPRILEVGFTLVEDRLPPLYYLTLKGWTSLTGFSETAVRLLSVIYGVLLVPVSAGIAALLFNRRVALITAALVTVNPFLLWYAQEARMYAPAVFFSTLAIWAFLHWLKTQLHPFIIHNSSLILYPSSFILFLLSATAGLYHHLYAGFILPGLALWLMIAYPRRPRLWLTLAVGGLIIAAAFAPIALAIWRFSAESTPGEPLHGFWLRGWSLLQAFTLWRASLPNTLSIIIPALIFLFTLLSFLPIRSQSPITNYQLPITNYQSPNLLISNLLLTPYLIATLLLTRNHLAFFGERYFIIMVPWLLMLAAVGVDKVNGWLLGGKAKAEAKEWIYYVVPVLLIGLTAIPLPGQWSVEASKEAWRQSVDYLAQQATPADAILIHPDWVRYPFQFYFKGPGQTYAAFSNVSADTELDGPLQGVIGDHPVVWLIQSHIDAPDPERRVEQWLAARYPLVTELYPPGIALKGYAPGYQRDTLPSDATPVDLRFSNGLRIVGYQADTTVAAVDDLFHPPSGWLHVTLYWTAAAPISSDVMPVVQLVGPEGVWGVNLDRAGDALKVFPPTQWFNADRASQPIIRHDLDVNLNPVTPPGEYLLVVKVGEEQFVLGEVGVR